jgi:dihydrofolate synthase/folylpolyglutamate synthase
LPGAHQIGNSGIAIACLEQLPGLDISREAIAHGLRHIDWPARMQRLSRGPLIDMLPPGWELWLDGGHNPGAGEVLAAAVAGWRDRPLYLIVGMLNTKDAAGFLAPLAKYARALWAVTIPGEQNPLPASAIVDAARLVGLPAEETASVAAALAAVIAGEPAPARVLICGSLHFAGTVLADNC